MKDLNHYISSRCELIEQRLDRLIPENELPHNILYKAARYSLLGAGKRLRPLLALAVAETFEGKVEDALTPACCLEMIHTYSLIHDDLPCMDNDDFRRGKPSLHRAFPEGHAVLTGDFLLTHAFDALANAPGLSAEQRIQLIAILSRHSGGDGMIGGQILDLESEGKQIDIDALRNIHAKKTGAMLIASLEFGGVVAGANVQQLDILKKFGQDIGLAFQIIDDVLDVTASKQKHGKVTSSDVSNNKVTYVSLMGVESAQALAQQLFLSASDTLKCLPMNTLLLQGLADRLVNRSN